MKYDIDKFIKDILSGQNVDLSLYVNPKFYIEMQLYALERIKFLLLDILRADLPYDDVKKHETFLLSKGIHTIDHNELNLLDYCIIAGLDDIGCIFAKLGCRNSINSELFTKRINQGFTKNNLPPMVAAANKTLQHIKMDIKTHDDIFTDLKHAHGKKHKPTVWQKIKRTIKSFPYKDYKFSILILSFGLCCIIAAPFTGGLSTVLLLTLGFPSILAGINSLQSAIAALNSYQQSEDSSKIAHEIEMLKTIHKDVCDQIKIQLFKIEIEHGVSVKVTNNSSKNAKQNRLLFLNFNNKSNPTHSVSPQVKRRKGKLSLPAL